MASPEGSAAAAYPAPGEFLVTSFLFDNRAGALSDRAQRALHGALRTSGYAANVFGTDDGSGEVFTTFTMDCDSSQQAVIDTAYALWDALDASGLSAVPITEARTISATGDQITGTAFEDMWPLMADRTVQLRDIEEMRAVLGGSVEVSDFV